jgi:CheY-like chemotaxis protein
MSGIFRFSDTSSSTNRRLGSPSNPGKKSHEENPSPAPADGATSPSYDHGHEAPCPGASTNYANANDAAAPENELASASALKSTGRNGAAGADRRRRRRAMISAPLRVRAVDLTEGGPEEISTTLDVSRNGVLFATSLPAFVPGMEVAVTFPYSRSAQIPQAEQAGRVVRVTELPDGRRSVAIALGVGVGEDVVDAAGRSLISKGPSAPIVSAPQDSEKPLVLVVDGDEAVRKSLKAYLESDGYNVIAVGHTADAHKVLKGFTPALVIAAIEGEDVPGYEVCSFCKATPRLRSVPVMLLTVSAYPSDYANAHSLGAVVCMAKPYRQERLGHVVRLLAPTPQAKEQSVPARAADPTRRACAGRSPERNGSAKLRMRPHWAI